jgi:dolichol-phosphate mannosyltransferase
MRRSLTLVLPTIDEAENLASLLPALLSLEEIAEVIVVDDGSIDGTPDLVRSFGDRVRLIEHPPPRSLRGSLQAGIDACDTALVGWMDADGTMPPEDVPRLCEAIANGADFAVGSRFAEGGALKGQTRAGVLGALSSLASMRHTPDGALTAAASLLLNRALLPAFLGIHAPHDWTSGFLVARRSVVAEFPLRGDHGEYFFDLWVRAARAGVRVVEIPCRMRPRMHGHSKTADGLAQVLRRGRRYLSRALALRLEGLR